MRFPTCKDVSKLATQAMDRPLSLREKLVMRLHLAVCQACRRFVRHVRFLRRASCRAGEDLPVKATLSREARERMKQQLGMGDD